MDIGDILAVGTQVVKLVFNDESILVVLLRIKRFVRMSGIFHKRLDDLRIIVKAQGNILVFFHFVLNFKRNILDKKGGIAVDIPV